MSPVSLRVERDVAVLCIDQPPVNGLGNTVRAGLLQGLLRAGSDDE